MLVTLHSINSERKMKIDVSKIILLMNVELNWLEVMTGFVLGLNMFTGSNK